MLSDYGCCRSEHDYCIVETISNLMDRGFTCYPEYEVSLDKRRGGYRLMVDVLAVRDDEEVLIEVGTLSNRHGDRLQLLKRLKPKAKIFHITQWKNRLTRYDWDELNRCPWNRFVDIRKMGESLG